MKKILFFAAFTAAPISCTKETPVTPPASEPTGAMKLKFDPKWNESDLVMGSTYTNAFGEDFTPNTFKYYVSNVVLNKEDGSTFAVPESYYLVDHTNGAVEFLIEGIPAAEYTSMQYTIGVDSIRNVSGAQSGALDPANKMFWSWSTGYIFYKMEGSSTFSTTESKSVVYHVGGFKEPNNALRNVTVHFESTDGHLKSMHGGSIDISPIATPSIHLFVQAEKLFSGTNEIHISELSTSMGANDNARKLADNYSAMFVLDHVHP